MYQLPVSALMGLSELPGLDFTSRMALICHDMTQRVPELSHINMRFVAVGFCQTRKDVMHGMYASLTPLRFEDGSLTSIRRGRKWTVQRLYDKQGVEMLYILNFYMPRFLKQDFRRRLITTVHELWHISPKFDGDIRRLGGRCYVHSGSQKNFDAKAESLADEWLSQLPDQDICDFLHFSYEQIVENYGRLYGKRFSVPKLIPLT